MLLQIIYCLAIFASGILTKVTFFYTFIGPAAILLLITFFPNFYFDIIALATMIMMVMFALVFSVTVALFNHEFVLAAFALLIPLACVIMLTYSMERLKKEYAEYA